MAHAAPAAPASCAALQAALLSMHAPSPLLVCLSSPQRHAHRGRRVQHGLGELAGSGRGGWSKQSRGPPAAAAGPRPFTDPPPPKPTPTSHRPRRSSTPTSWASTGPSCGTRCTTASVRAAWGPCGAALGAPLGARTPHPLQPTNPLQPSLPSPAPLLLAPAGKAFPEAYRVGLKRAVAQAGRIAPTGCPERGDVFF